MSEQFQLQIDAFVLAYATMLKRLSGDAAARQFIRDLGTLIEAAIQDHAESRNRELRSAQMDCIAKAWTGYLMGE